MLDGLNLSFSDKTIEQLINVGLSLIILFIGWIAIRVILRIARKTLERSSLDPVLYRFILKIIRIVLWIILVLTIMERFGFKMNSLITVLAAAGAAIALALKDSLANVAGGIMILVNKPFAQDDYIDINGTTGKVRDIDLFVTHLHTYDNKVITIPNGLVNTSVLINYTRENRRRVDCCFGIGYDDDIQKAKDILAAIADSDPMICKDPPPVIGVAGQNDNCISIDLKVWCETDDYWDVKYFLEENVKLAFDEAGITIPFPQMDVHIRRK
ncbi:mechanosensitive ion channel family protein [bacterium 210820-DFI.6.37]|nr:mechanosensitive ion channel family protein [bacterium 210820-DFI.6.37]